MCRRSRVADLTPDDVVRRMVGREITQLYPPKQPAGERSQEVVLSVRGLGDGERFRRCRLSILRKGEILGIGGLIGSGRTEIAEGICGLRAITSGEVLLHGKQQAIGTYADAVKAGLVYLSEDRKGSGLFLDLSIAQNISVLDLDALTGHLGLIDTGAEAELASDFAPGAEHAHGRHRASGIVAQRR